MGKTHYSAEIKWAVVKAKLVGELTNEEIMGKFWVKNKSQIKTWMRWFRNTEIYRFDQPIGKQYSYGHGPEGQSPEDKITRKIAHLEMENEILKKYMELGKELNLK